MLGLWAFSNSVLMLSLRWLFDVSGGCNDTDAITGIYRDSKELLNSVGGDWAEI